MPNARRHDEIAVSSAVLMTPVSAAVWLSLNKSPIEAGVYTLLFIGSHLICSYWLSPDLDLNSAIDDRWGPLKYIWKPYEWAVPHRHWFSHSGISVIFRLLYLALYGLGVVLIVNTFAAGTLAVVGGWLMHIAQTYPLECGLFLLGAVVSDSIHTMTDYLYTSGKRWLRTLPRPVRRLFVGRNRTRRS